MSIALWYVNRKEFVKEKFIELVYVTYINALSINKSVVNVFIQHSLSLSYVHGQYYDGANNM